MRMSVTLARASSIVDATLKKARELKQMPQTVVVLDTGGHLVCAKREDGSGIIRFEVAVGKAYGALGMGWGSRTMMERAAQNPNFLTAIAAASGGRLVPNPGGVLIRGSDNRVLGAIGISGDTGDNDEIIAVAGIEAAGLKADPGGTKKQYADTPVWRKNQGGNRETVFVLALTGDLPGAHRAQSQGPHARGD
jgi:uncharacterized protein GlcG (DUF336 family)